MRSSTVLTLIGATLAVASPVHHNLHKKAIVWDIVTDVVFVTVTESELPATPSTTDPSTSYTQQAVTVSTPPPPPPPSSTPPPPPPTTSSAPPPPPPAPTTSSTPPPPPPAPTTSSPLAPAIDVAEVPATSPPAATATPSPVAPAVEVPASSPAAVAAPAAAPSDLASTGVYYHSAHRANHSASSVTWDSTLAGYAAITAAKCVFAHDMSEGAGGYGQNIDSVGYGDSTQDPGGVWEAQVKAWNPSAVLANAITNDWYLSEAPIFAGDNADKESFYGQANPPQTSPEWGHFSQIVWKSSLTVGCATQYCGTGAMLGNSYSWFTVCNYGPAGNYLGEFNTNVSPDIGHPPVGVRASDGNFGVPTPWEVSS